MTGTRADYGLLYWLMREIDSDPELELQIVVTGMHLSPEFGLTYQMIESDGFGINHKVEMLLSSDTPVGITKSIGLGVIGFADALDQLKPDIMVVLGDRYEILAAVQSALIARIPVAHIAGGDTTEGAFDEAIRHSITKMSHLHFVTNEISQRRVFQLGENPKCIFNVGSPGLDNVRRLQLLNKMELAKQLNFSFRSKNILVTFHPVTLSDQSSAAQFQELLQAFQALGDDVGIIFTKPNADTDGRILIQMIDDYVAQHCNSKAFVSLGQLRYLSVINHVDAIVGNSSSGLYEVPSFHKPTVNIGSRQQGRLKADSVIDCQASTDSILYAIKAAFELDCSQVINPYGDGKSSERIVKLLKSVPDYKDLLIKHFFEIGDDYGE